MASFEVDELVVIKEKILKLDIFACHQILYHFADVLFLKPSVLAGVFKMAIDDGVKYSQRLAEIKEGGDEE